MKPRDITVSVTLDCAPMLAQLEALAEHVRALVDAPGDGDRGEGTLITDEPAIGEQVTDSDDIVWQRFEGGWHWWADGPDGGWTPWLRTWDYVQTGFARVRATTDDDRRRVGLPVRGENTPPASQNGPQDARDADSGTGGPPEPENAVQGRIGWLRLKPGDERRLLMRETPGGWIDSDEDGDPLLLAKYWRDAEFTPIRTLADDEVAVKRDHEAAAEKRGAARALREAANRWQQGGWADDLPSKGAGRIEGIIGMAQRATAFLRASADALETGEDA